MDTYDNDEDRLLIVDRQLIIQRFCSFSNSSSTGTPTKKKSENPHDLFLELVLIFPGRLIFSMKEAAFQITLYIWHRKECMDRQTGQGIE